MKLGSISKGEFQLKLRPWIFDEDKEVVLKWIGNATIKNKQWYIRAGFQYNNQIEFLEFPIAALSLLKAGASYRNGQLLEHRAEGIVYDVTIPQLAQYKVITALEACKAVGYYLFAKPELISQSVFEFSVEGNTFYLPQFEFIRVVFAVNKVMSNAMMQPNGMELLVKSASTEKQTASLELMDDISNNVVKDDNFIRYFVWLYFSQGIKASFESVYTLLTQKKFNNEYLKLEAQLPAVLNTFIRFRGIEKDNKYLILQWLGSKMEGTTFTDIEVKHKAFKKRIAAPGNRKYRKSLKENDGEKVLNEDATQRSKQDSNQEVVDLTSTQLQFGQLAIVQRIYESEQEVNQGDIYISNQGQGGGIQKQEQVVGLDESILGETIQPIEFKTLEVTNDIKGQGLERFIKMIQIFQNEYSPYSVALNFVYLPMGRKFSFLANGNRRVAAIARITNKYTFKSSYIIDVSTVDNRSLSTLMIKNMFEGREENIIKKILRTLVYNSGSWNSDSLKSYEYARIKHISQSDKEWANRLKKYIL